jgi:hypothetical protein
MSLSYVALSIIALLPSLKRAPDSTQYYDLLPIMFKVAAFVEVNANDLGHQSQSPVLTAGQDMYSPAKMIQDRSRLLTT